MTSARPVLPDTSPATEPVVIKVRDNGPYKVTGPVVIVDADGNRFAVEEGRPVALCRCGASRTKPFCDRSHREAGFDACERAVAEAGPAGPAPPGPPRPDAG
jgi:CDGSH iron-sulfur domain-containing protein 3